MISLIRVRVCKGNSQVSLREKVLQLSECVGEQAEKAFTLAELYCDIETGFTMEDAVDVTITIKGNWLKRLYTKWVVMKGVKRFTTAYPDSYVIWSI